MREGSLAAWGCQVTQVSSQYLKNVSGQWSLAERAGCATCTVPFVLRTIARGRYRIRSELANAKGPVGEDGWPV